MDDTVIQSAEQSDGSVISWNATGSDYATLSITGSGTTIGTARLELNSTETVVNPSSSWAYAQPMYITPIEFTFQNTSWKYTLCYIFNIIFAPWLVMWSKLTGRSTGFRVRNPHYNRPGIGATPYIYDPIRGFSGYSGHSGYSGISGYSGYTRVQPSHPPVGDFDE